MKKVLFTGASGRIGSGLINRLSELFDPKSEVYLLQNNNQINIGSISRSNTYVINLPEDRYDLALHLAAITDTKYCENPENHKRVRDVNISLTEKICGLSDRVILVSTERVFDASSGEFRESDEVSPGSFYGISKAEAEKVVVDNGGSVIRIQTMLGVQNRIVDAVLDAAKGKDYYPFWDNDYLRPSYFPDFLKVMKKVILGNEGIYHVSCNGDSLSRYEIAFQVLDMYKKANILLARDSLASESRKEGERKIVLNADRTGNELDLNFTDSRDALREHILLTINTNKLSN